MKSLRCSLLGLRSGAAVLAAAATLFVGVLGLADEPKKGDNADPAAAEKTASGDMSAVAAAAQLAVQGESRKSPLLLLAAAEILADMTASDRDAAATAETTAADPDGQLPELTVDTLIARARELAQGNKAMTAAVETMVDGITSDSRGLVYRQGKDLESVPFGDTTYKVINPGNDRLNPGEELTLTNVVFEGGRPAEIIVVGDGDGDLDLWVYDGNTGGLIGSDTDTTSLCVTRWTTRYEGPFTIKVRNVGSVWERFYVLANW